MEIIVPIYLIAGFFAIAISFPSVIKLVKVKSSHEFSITSWTGWLAYQIVALIYGIYIWVIPFIIVNLLWITFYVIMLYLIWHYRPHRVAKRKKRRRKKKRS